MCLQSRDTQVLTDVNLAPSLCTSLLLPHLKEAKEARFQLPPAVSAEVALK